jgi:hypothetical protein
MEPEKGKYRDLFSKMLRESTLSLSFKNECLCSHHIITNKYRKSTSKQLLPLARCKDRARTFRRRYFESCYFNLKVSRINAYIFASYGVQGIAASSASSGTASSSSASAYDVDVDEVMPWDKVNWCIMHHDDACINNSYH